MKFFLISTKITLWKSGIFTNVVQWKWLLQNFCNWIVTTFSENFKLFGQYLWKLEGKKYSKTVTNWLLLALKIVLLDGKSSRFLKSLCAFDQTGNNLLTLLKSNFSFTWSIFSQLNLKTYCQQILKLSTFYIFHTPAKTLYKIA